MEKFNASNPGRVFFNIEPTADQIDALVMHGACPVCEFSMRKEHDRLQEPRGRHGKIEHQLCEKCGMICVTKSKLLPLPTVKFARYIKIEDYWEPSYEDMGVRDAECRLRLAEDLHARKDAGELLNLEQWYGLFVS